MLLKPVFHVEFRHRLSIGKNNMADIQMFHGLTAYSGRSIDPVSLKLKADLAVAYNEVCVSDKPIGDIGLVLAGQLTVLFAEDCYSRINRNGYRSLSDPDQAGSFYHMLTGHGEQSVINSWCKNDAPELRSSRRDYAEGWLIANGASCVWVKRKASDRHYFAAKSLALKLHVPLIEISSNMRIWNYC